MASTDEFFPSKWLKAADLKEAETWLTLVKADAQMIGSEESAEKKLVLEFNETDKMLIMNKTNTNKITECLGKDYLQWAGARICLVKALVSFGKKEVNAIRINKVAAPEGLTSGSLFRLTKGVEVKEE